MPWVTTKDGRHVDTDWFDKEKQIKQNEKEADKLNNSQKIAELEKRLQNAKGLKELV